MPRNIYRDQPMTTELTTPAIHPIAQRLRADLAHNDHMTAEPMFCLQILVRDSGYDSDFTDNQCWWNAEQLETIYDDDTDERKADLNFDSESPDWDGPYGYKDRWETVMIALTEEGITSYMLQDGHNVRRRAFRGRTRTYVESFHRCQEMITIRQHLLQLATP